MSAYSGCVMEGYGVIPSPPRRLRVSNVKEDFAMVHWSSPSFLASSVTGYNLHFRPIPTYEAEYKLISNVHPPYILEELYGNAEYEVLQSKFLFSLSKISPQLSFFLNYEIDVGKVLLNIKL